MPAQNNRKGLRCIGFHRTIVRLCEAFLNLINNVKSLYRRQKKVLSEAFVIVYLFCRVSHCYKEFALHNAPPRATLQCGLLGSGGRAFVLLLQVDVSLASLGLGLRIFSNGLQDFYIDVWKT